MRRDFVTPFILAALLASLPDHASAQAATKKLPRLALSPGDPLVRSAPPATAFGRDPAESKDYVLDFHGFVLLPLNFAILERDDPEPGQSSTAIHSPPLIPQDLRQFEWTGVIPDPWIQLNLSYGNATIYGTAIIAATTASEAAGIFDPTEQLNLSDAFLTVNLSQPLKTPFSVKVGAFTGRYGPMGQYDAGRYGTPLMARTNTVGVTTTAGVELPNLSLVFEHGIGGSLGRPPRGTLGAAWNGFADGGAVGTPSADAPNGVGSTFVNQLHAGLDYAKLAQLTLHYVSAWSQDEQASVGLIPDGSIRVLGASGRLTLSRGGHLYVGAARTDANNAATVSGVIEVLNARGGPELIREYLGPDSGGDGALTTIGAQYDLSVARMLYGDFFTGKSPDVRLSLFGVSTSVTSDDPAYDEVTKLKLGAEVTYSALSWFALSARVDHATPDTDESEQAFQIISPRLLFHTNWLSRDEFTLQYSRFVYGDDVVVRTGSPPTDDPTARPDQDVFSLSGTFWW